MGRAMENRKVDIDKNDEKRPLVGTWFSLGIVGVSILATYILLISIYMFRL
ncbi:hypothetical protein [Evansella cellulosilytica]|uniref:Uncharacterized protein n=1 Tax=Evansella cellulosilytica (strain ATCC 21833 / DSM 2522 / FERM P-1141 / JCM 9156 / N-4) TaxID=649639 RepID=E6TR64_EVAC2|nr:hypothetical protein [Evansella cellulosilytica]ADU30576.1 hypothetical protein Bcell_2316 [Evansella cellulosilytica DSM 2522]